MSEQHLPILDFGSTSTAFADTVAIEQHGPVSQLAVMYVTQAPPFFEIFVREGNGSRSEQQS
ncbi:MAG: hypothetical protein AUI16_00635 [Alphaproteobacteria bacterium 13_2_20CM_2_64_7]|jgi:hypothetical protein|nr:MAG: hypothetical protein AUI16_00635 [Alphaproteobacteria bacterium 13_2_20CM_2_64_7]